MPGGLPAVHFAGEPRFLGALPPHPVSPFPPLMAARPLLPRAQWREIDLSWTGAPIMDQNGQNSCVGHAAATVATIAWAQKGESLTRFSPGFIYAQINHGRDQGAVVSDAALELEKTGVCTEQEVPEGIIYQQQIPRTAYATAQRYRLGNWFRCTSFDAICTVLTLGFPGVGGFLVGNNFTHLDQEGCVPVPDQVIGGHALALIGLKKARNNRWLVKFQNSWTQQFGIGGYGFMDEAFMNFTVRQYGGQLDAFAAVWMAPDPQEDPGPVAA
jgi:hypothetical protein